MAKTSSHIRTSILLSYPLILQRGIEDVFSQPATYATRCKLEALLRDVSQSYSIVEQRTPPTTERVIHYRDRYIMKILCRYVGTYFTPGQWHTDL